MSRILKGLFGKRMTVASKLPTRPMASQKVAFAHPEKRRTFPLVYYNWVEQKVALEKVQNQKSEPKVVASSPKRPRGRKEFLGHLIHNRKITDIDDMQRWSEFRRKLIYGTY
ncbi:hypothetical protein KR059_012740 [Drosophila kikkawai]|nr:hypothetical protein KR059_012740 [Drosophila kikkawai]